VEVRRLLKRQVNSRATSLQVSALQEKRTILQRRITRWQEIQSVYMPGAFELQGRQRVAGGEVSHPESILLRLPSGYPVGHGLPATLVDMEKRLRLAQADDALVELRRLLRVTLGLWDYKFSQLGPSQRANTRARSMITRFEEKIQRCVERYQSAWTALARLDPAGSWSERFLELKPGHVKGPGRGKDDESEGRRELSWIWMMRSDSGNLNTGGNEIEVGDSKSLVVELYISI
jgi:hypothetical protein